MDEQMPLDIGIGSRSQSLPLVVQEVADQSAEGFVSFGLGVRLLAGRILAEADLSVEVFCYVARFAEVDRTELPERDAPLLCADLVLKNVNARASFAQTDAKAGNVVVPSDEVIFTSR